MERDRDKSLTVFKLTHYPNSDLGRYLNGSTNHGARSGRSVPDPVFQFPDSQRVARQQTKSFEE